MANWAANRMIGLKSANELEGEHDVGVRVAWKRGPQGQGWHYITFLDFVWKGCFKTSEEALQKGMRKLEREGLVRERIILEDQRAEMLAA